MLGSLLMMAILAQAPSDTPAVAADEAPKAAAPKAVAKAKAQPKNKVAKNRARRARPVLNRQQAFALQQQEEERQAQLFAAQQERMAAYQLQAAQVQAVQTLAQAEAMKAQIAERQYILNSQRAGAPQVFQPGVGMVPYQYGVAPAAPTFWGMGR